MHSASPDGRTLQFRAPTAPSVGGWSAAACPKCRVSIAREGFAEGQFVRRCACGQHLAIVSKRGRAAVRAITREDYLMVARSLEMWAALWAELDGGDPPAPAAPTAATLPEAQVSILSLLCVRGGMNAAAIGRALAMPRRTAYDHLAALLKAAAVRREGAGRGCLWYGVRCEIAANRRKSPELERAA